MSKSLSDHKILCISHLRWETTLFQRPQQLMSRFAEMTAGVIYVNQFSTRRWLAAFLGGRRSELAGRAGPRLLWRNWPLLPGTGRSEIIERINLSLLAAALARLAAAHGSPHPLVLWLYHPWAYPLVERIAHTLLVYDCMDPFVAFRLQRGKERIARLENALIRRADVVFTGGRSLQSAKEGINPRTYCFPSGVDHEHFEKALAGDLEPPPDIATLPHPVFGYWGAVDERLDFDLLGKICDRWPEGSVVLLGPLVGMERPPLERPNFHYLGEKEYASLPAYLAAFDVCLLPFVASKLTEAISPTKTPEYLSGGRPVVSTAIPDVAQTWGDVVAVARNAGEFIEALERELARPRPDRELAAVSRRRAPSWDSIASKMREKIEAAMAGKFPHPKQQ